MPILYNDITGGHFLCVLFFLCVTLAGLSSVVSLMERPIRVLTDFGCKYIYMIGHEHYTQANLVRKIT